MWYLEADTLFLLLITSLAMILFSGVTRLISRRDLGPKVLLLANIAVIGTISWQLLLWSLGYIIITYILIIHLKSIKHGKKALFFIYCLLCTVPFFSAYDFICL